MNTQQFPTTVADAPPTLAAPTIHQIAARLGREDAEDGALCVPELCLPRTAHRAYAEAYHAVRPSALSAQLLGLKNFVSASDPQPRVLAVGHFCHETQRWIVATEADDVPDAGNAPGRGFDFSEALNWPLLEDGGMEDEPGYYESRLIRFCTE